MPSTSDQPTEKWADSRAKALLREEMLAGGVDDASDPNQVHNSNPEFQKWPLSRFKPNMKNLITACNNPKVKMVKWGKSKAKEMLADDIIKGEVLPAMAAKDAYEMREEYKSFKYENFRTNLKNLREVIAKDFARMQQDSVDYVHDRELVKDLRNNNPLLRPPCPNWHQSAARQLLKDDMTTGKHLTMKPMQLHATKQEHRMFPLDVFRNHIYQEADERAKRECRFKKKLARAKARGHC